MENLTKNILIPLDGSKNALKSLDYLDLMFGPKHNLDVTLLYIWPLIPPVLTDEKTMDKEIWVKLTAVEKKNVLMGERILAVGKTALVKKGFDEKRIKELYQRQEKSTGQDICNWANRKQVDAVLLTRRGRTDLDTFFMGGTSDKLVNYCGNYPVWIAGGGIHEKKVLVGVDASENALRAVDHAGFMLSGTDCRATLFHSIRHLRRFVPMEVLEGAEELQELWKSKAGKQIAPYMEKARGILLDAGLTKTQIAVKVVDGSRSGADDILKEARDNGYGTIVLGRRGQSAMKQFIFGSVTSQVLHHSAGLAIWIVQ